MAKQPHTDMANTQSFTQKIKRTVAHLTTTPFQNRWLNKAALARLETVITQAEKGHRGEIRLIIEKALPMSLAWHSTARQRAEDLFAHYRIWDTAERTGVLLYLNLTEHRLEIIADRGISDKVSQHEWQTIADSTVAKLYAQERIEALEGLIDATAELLRQYYPSADDPNGNELPNDIVVL